MLAPTIAYLLAFFYFSNSHGTLLVSGSHLTPGSFLFIAALMGCGAVE